MISSVRLEDLMTRQPLASGLGILAVGVGLLACGGNTPPGPESGGGTTIMDPTEAPVSSTTDPMNPVDGTGSSDTSVTTDADTTETTGGTAGNIVELGIGTTQTCAVMTNGRLICWGVASELLGIDDLPTEHEHIEDAVSVSLSANHACAVLGDQTVRCWGANDNGELGDGTETDSSIPVTTVGLDDVVQVTAGENFSCALRGDGGIRCWGLNLFGALGDGTTEDRLTPVDVVGLPAPALEVQAVGNASTSACARLEGGGLACWGQNDAGQLGVGDMVDSPSPLTVAITDVTSLGTSKGSNACVVSQGDAHCWGWQLTSTPAPIVGLEDVVDVSVGTGHTCAIGAAGDVSCFGWRNENGQLGPSVSIDELTEAPVDVPLPGPATQIVNGTAHSCALLADGEIYCWGLGRALGIGTTDDSPEPVRPMGL